MAGNDWNSLKWLNMTRNCWTLIEIALMAGMVGNGCP